MSVGNWLTKFSPQLPVNCASLHLVPRKSVRHATTMSSTKPSCWQNISLSTIALFRPNLPDRWCRISRAAFASLRHDLRVANCAVVRVGSRSIQPALAILPRYKARLAKALGCASKCLHRWARRRNHIRASGDKLEPFCRGGFGSRSSGPSKSVAALRSRRDAPRSGQIRPALRKRSLAPPRRVAKRRPTL